MELHSCVLSGNVEGHCPASGNKDFCVLRHLIDKVMALFVCFQTTRGGWGGEILLGGLRVLCLHRAVSATSPFPT